MASFPKGRNGTLLGIFIGLLVVALIIGASYMYRVEQRSQFADVNSLMAQGIAHFRAENYELSVQTLGSIPRELVDDWHIPYYLGSALIQLKDYEKGAARLEEALVLNPSDKNILFALGVAYFKLGNLSLSKAYFSSVLEVDPGNEEAKGLMDIMARLERRSVAESGAEENSKAP